MTSNSILWITTIVMVCGGLFILLTGKRRTPSEGLHTILHGIVPIIAACAYFAMATGQGLVLLPVTAADGTVTAGATRIFYFARYVDWSLTTPLLLIALSMTAMHANHKRAGLVAGAVLADVMMIVTGFAFGASEVPWMKWTWFLISCVAFVGVFYVIWISQMEANALERDDVRATYRRNATILTVLWLAYPVVIGLAPDGLNILGDTISVLLIAILDVIAKVVYGYMTLVSDKSATDRDLAEHPEAELARPGLVRSAVA